MLLVFPSMILLFGWSLTGSFLFDQKNMFLFVLHLFAENQSKWREKTRAQSPPAEKEVNVYSLQGNMFGWTLNSPCLSEKLTSQPQNVQNLPFLIQRTLTHYILRLVTFRSHRSPNICLKMPNCAFSTTFWESHKKHTPKVGVYLEKFNIGNLAPVLFMVF